MLTQSAIQNFFNADYCGTNQLLTQILEPIFGEYDLGYDEITKTQAIKDKAKGAHIKTIKHVATFWAEGLDIKVFDVTLEDNCHIHVARKNIQLLVREYVEKFEGAFIVFHYENTANRSWRLSYLEKRQNTAASTNAKRYTYLCGKDYPCRTIAERFYALQSQDLNAVNLEKAFSVEALSDEFFEEYRNFYQDLVNFVKFEDDIFDEFISFANGDEDLAEKYARDYIKKLMGRLVFIQFLQNKAWLNQDIHYTHTLFNSCTEKQKDDFLDNVLEPLFFGVFNTPKHQRESLFKSERWDKNLYSQWEDFPYLNGGLFERDDLDKLNLPLPSYFFSNPERKDRVRKPSDEYYNDACGIFDFFDRYNFTIDESDPLDREVGVDPEMLGKIFENLLEDNKDKGAFYTPKEIVNYMCKESLIAYLVSEAQQASEVNKQRQENFEAAIRALVEDPEMTVSRIKRYDEKQLEVLSNALMEVKICDPAIGSGAFPMGLLNLLFKCRNAVNDALGLTVPPAELKKDIIRNNIYGVDIEKGAIDIARLRFWLSIVVDLKEPEALPNFDYKFMQGNSLLEQFAGVDLSDMFATKATEGKGSGVQLISFDEVSTSQTILLERLRHYFGMRTGEDKHQLREKVNQAVADLIRAKVNEAPELISKLQDLDVSANDQFFLWHTWFAEVFNRPSKQGFDIVIGNPPYGAKLSTEDKTACKRVYSTAKTISGVQKGSLDTFSLFIELGFRLLRKNGAFGMIIPLSFTSSDSMSGVHRLLLSNCKEIHVSSYAVRPEPVFKNAVVNTSILSFVKTETQCERLMSTRLNRKKGADFNLQKLVDNLEFVNVNDLLMYGRIPKISTPIEQDILRKVRLGRTISSYKTNHGKPIYYRFAGGRYFKVITNYTTNSSAERRLELDERYADVIGCILSSNLSFWFYQIYSDNLNWKANEIENFTIPNIDEQTCAKLVQLYNKYLVDIEANANIRTSSGDSTYNVSEFKEYKIVRSKSIIDEIDDTIGVLYGLTKEEIEFIKNYEIEFRMAGE